MDADVYDYAVAESVIRDMSIAEVIRWMIRDGRQHRVEMAARQAAYVKARAEYGW